MFKKNNKVEISTDGKNLYISLKVISSKVGRFLLLFFSTLIGLALFVIIYYTSKEEFDVKSILPVLGVGTMLFFTIKSYLWNKYGSEDLIITDKSISFSYFFGFISTDKTTLIFNELAAQYNIVQGVGDDRVGSVAFYNYKLDDGLPEVIHTTSVLISEASANYIFQEISKLFNEADEDMFTIDYSLN